MFLEKESHVLEKIKLLSVAFDHAEMKGQILDSNLYHGPTLSPILLLFNPGRLTPSRED